MPNRFRPVDPDALGIASQHAKIDTTIAHPARVYDYVLGGKDNYPADREVAEQALAIAPSLGDEVRANRAWLRRAVTYAAEQGIDQILDIGTGIPTVGPTHQVAQRVQPDVRVVYVDNDPIVLAHSRALLVDDHRTTVMQADVREPDSVLARARTHLDFDRPILLMFVGLWYFVPDEDDPAGLIARYRDALAPGSMLLITHVLDSPEIMQVKKIYKTSSGVHPRSREDIARLFHGWDLIDPGLVPLHQWRPEGGELSAEFLLGGAAILPTRP